MMRLMVVSLFWMLVVSASVSFLPAQIEEVEPKKPSLYDQGMAIMKHEGVDAGIRFFEENAIETGSYRSIFGLAWGYWVKGKIDEADKICDFLIFKEPSPVLVAHGHYLKGHIQIIRGNHFAAIAHFSAALPVYQEKNRHEDLFKSYLGLAAAYILAKNYEVAAGFLNQALVANEEAGKNLGHYFHLRSRLEFGRGLYQEALRYSRESYQQFGAIADDENMANALVDIGFYLMLSGDMAGGLERSQEAADIINDKGYKKLSYYGAINFILAYRCSGLKYEAIEKKVRMWIDEHQDNFLKSLLDFSLECECP